MLPATAVRVLPGHHEPADAVYPAGGIEICLGEGRVVALGNDHVAGLRGQLVNDSRSRAAGHGMLAEDGKLEVTGTVRVVTVDDQPVVTFAGRRGRR